MIFDDILKYALLILSAFLDLFYSYCFFRVFFNRRLFFKQFYRLFIIFTLSIAAIFGVNILENMTLNLMATFIIIIFDICVFDTNIGKGLLFAIAYIAINIAAEIFVGTLFYVESIPTKQEYNLLINSPFAVISNYIIKYIPILICKQSFSKSKIKMKNSTFLMYLMIPFTNIVMITINSFLGINFQEPRFKIYYSLYSLFMMIGSFLIFYSFQRHSMELEKEQELLENKLKSQSDNELLYLSAKAMRSRLKVAEESMEAERIIRHDRRHFEAMLLELMKQGETQKVQELLEQRVNSEPKKTRKWCDNETINATIEHYVSMAEKEYIQVRSSLNIPKELTVDSLQLAIALGNLIENAIHANQKLPVEDRFINLKAICKKQLLISIENACSSDVKLDENGHPFTKKQNHGIGTKSVIAFAEQNDSDVLYSIENGIFTVQMMIRA